MSDLKRAKLSIIVPIYNVESYLKKCVVSILNQTEASLQIILVDDGSTDKSGDIADLLAEQDSRIVSLHKSNGGGSSARNYGMRYAIGDYITFVDSDDWIEPTMYELMLNEAYRYQADVVSNSVDSKEITIVSKEKILSTYFLKGQVSCCNKIFRFKGTCLETYKINDGDIDIRTCFDFMKTAEKWVIIPGAFYNYRQNNISFGRSKYTAKDKSIVLIAEGVAKETALIDAGAYPYANFHVLHAKMDIICKYVMHGFKTRTDKEEFKNVREEYCKSIRRNIFPCLSTSYFSKTEKMQLLCISLSYYLFYIIKKMYIKFKPLRVRESVRM